MSWNYQVHAMRDRERESTHTVASKSVTANKRTKQSSLSSDGEWHSSTCVKFTPTQIEGFTWSHHLFNLKGKIRKPPIKNTSIVLMYMTIYIKFCNKNLQCFFCSRYNLRKVNYIALFPSYILKNVKLYIQEHSLEPQILVRRLIYEIRRD